MGYISLVAAVKEARRKVISSRLISEFLEIAQEKKLKYVHLYTDKTNKGAIEMYRKLGFSCYHPIDEPRPDDIHLIISLDNNGAQEAIQ